MRIVVKTRLGSAKQKIESFGNGRYMISLLSNNHEDANAELLTVLSKYFITPVSRFQYVSGLEGNDKVLETI